METKKPSKPKKTAATSGDVAADPLLEQLGQAFAAARKEADEWAAGGSREGLQAGAVGSLDPSHDPEACRAEIETIRAAGGRALTHEQAIEFITRPIYLGRPTTEWPDGITPAQLLEWFQAAGGQVTAEMLEFARLDEAARALREAARDAKAAERARIDAEHRAAQGQPPKRTNAKGAGRPRTRTQYDAAVERRADLYRRLVKAPAIGKAAGYRADARFEAIFLAVMNDATVDRHGQWRELSKRLSAARLAAPDGGRFRRMRQQFEREQIKG